MEVYTVLVEQTSRFSGLNTYVDSIYLLEEDSWNRIEEKYNSFTESIFMIPFGKIWFAEFRDKQFIVAYKNEYGIGYIKFIIHQGVVK